MGTPLSYLQQRANDDWLVGYDSHEFFVLSDRLYQEYGTTTRSAPLKILLAEPDAFQFLAHFIAACAAECHVFLANPNWVQAEWQQVLELVQPDRVVGIVQTALVKQREVLGKVQFPSTPFPPPLILIPTGGSSGKIRFVMHTWQTLMASVRGFRQYFGVDRVNSCCVLPLHHVSGLMQFLRSFTSGGQLALCSCKALADNLPCDPGQFFLSLVPTQLDRLLPAPLPHFHTVFLGGAPAWPELLAQARARKIRLAPTYGMTETASQIATLRPEDFFAGQTGCGQVLPHAQIEILQETIAIRSSALALGYYPNYFEQTTFQPDDLGCFDDRDSLHLIGRASDKIITGGENVFPAEVEAAIRATGLVQDVCVVGASDRHWGQAISAIYVPLNASEEQLQSALANNLSKYKRPKHWVAVETLPRNAQGKIDRSQITKLIQQQIEQL
ncbi:MAG TPA: 2-succinylbenzoate--CoA ligase [Thermosynechococcaceae cyanobacterium]